MDGGSDGVRVIAVHACTPEVPLKDDVLSLSGLQEESWNSDGECAVDGIYFESRQSLRLGSKAKLIVQWCVWFWQFSGRVVYMRAKVSTRELGGFFQDHMYVMNLDRSLHHRLNGLRIAS
jgi:hypothetical protein